jgi:sugar lactone lactonase YvrE
MKFFLVETLILALVLAGCASAQQPGGSRTGNDHNDTGNLSLLLRNATSEIQRWGDGNNRRDVRVYSIDPEKKDELFQAVQEAGFYQVGTGENPRDWELQRAVLRWCVSPNIDKWPNEIQVSAAGERTVHTYAFMPLQDSPFSELRATVEIQRWGDGNNRRDVTVYSFDPVKKDELLQAVKDAGFYQAWTDENPRDWDLQKGVLRWCVSPNTEKWDNEIQFTAVGEKIVHTYGFKPLLDANGVLLLAGSTRGYAEGNGAEAKFNRPFKAAVDNAGNVYVADTNNHRIRKITPKGMVTTFAGSTQGYTDGTATVAKFNDPVGVAVDGAGNIYVADNSNERIRKITPEGVVTTLAGSTRGYADGIGVAAKFFWPNGLAVDSAGNVYVADAGNHRIRKITPEGVVTTLAGSTQGYADGTGVAAKFNGPQSVAVDSAGNVYVADTDNHRIRKITPAGVVTTLAGGGATGRGNGTHADGTGTEARFNFPRSLAVDRSGNVYVVDFVDHRIRKVNPEGVVTTLAGTESVESPTGVAVDDAGNVYVTDDSNNRIYKITITTP